MNRIVTVFLLCLVAVGSQAGVISDIQTGLIAENTNLDMYNVTVVATRYNGFFAAEPPFGANNGIWVYTGSSTGAMPGDVVNIQGGLYYEYYGLSEVEATATVGAVVTILGPGAVPAPSYVEAADLLANPEPWESCFIMVTDGMQVTVAPNSYGEWFAEALGGGTVMFDDYWYDDTTVLVGDCYNHAAGLLNYNFNAFKLEVLVDGIEVVNCAIDNDEASFGAVKALFR